ncbi:hypothetical protein [Helicobacter ailurogastricus]|uniref:Uncharacterized protein n=1 Tax=Helicobacter ailurogastricus TaxID=1578720 RepID=A0A0K2XYY5_9HELI|nr:hypothetical protein [Helicobacter ailurogastricus]CRF41818.1 hypothetical protein HAL011_16360 [Helicobacter ailurogastricus]CRF43354.1 hypothetical protein HAL013_15880 [Helicobacter ailurogastricus]CRF45042.1 hypothetical protein HAL09_16750 [Helicobacter ailurogastricus]CRF52291.1 hypothetical protein HAL07_04170 [Helicobacter ailurogastricus]BDQ29415.1 hypothetical protein ASB7_12520 [Helicobacter ailurogastricus]
MSASPLIPKDSQELALKRAKLDLIIAAKIYGLEPKHLEHVLSTFKVLEKNKSRL